MTSLPRPTRCATSSRIGRSPFLASLPPMMINEPRAFCGTACSGGTGGCCAVLARCDGLRFAFFAMDRKSPVTLRQPFLFGDDAAVIEQDLAVSDYRLDFE